MPHNHRNFSLRGLSLLGLTLSGLLFMNCSTQDADTLPLNQSQKEFDKVEDLPDLNDPDPEGVVLEIGDLDDSHIVESIINGISNAENDQEMAVLVEKLLESMGNSVDHPENLDPEILAFLQELDVEKATRIIKGELKVSPKIKEFTASVAGKGNFSTMLPTMVFPKINGKILKTIPEETIHAVARQKGKSNAADSGVSESQLRVSHWEKSCKDAAQYAFDVRVGELELQKEDQLSMVDLNYETRLSEIEVNHELRLTQQNETYNFQVDYLILNVTGLFQAVSVINNPQLKTKLLVFVAIYIIKAGELVNNWNGLSIAAIGEAYEEELRIIEEHKHAMIEKVKAAYDKAVKYAEEILEKAIENCHNQGSGN